MAGDQLGVPSHARNSSLTVCLPAGLPPAHRSVKRLQLVNTGDVGTKFVWDASALGPHFSVSPPDGFLAPGQDVKLDVTFAPTGVHADIRVERVRLKVGRWRSPAPCRTTGQQP